MRIHSISLIVGLALGCGSSEPNPPQADSAGGGSRTGAVKPGPAADTPVTLQPQQPRKPAANPVAGDTPVEHVTGRVSRAAAALGTKSYEPSEPEKPFFTRLAADEVATGGLAGDYDINTKDGKYVGWFGIVRQVQEDPAAGKTILTVEHKYFDGLTDVHILALSFNGSGDFRAALHGVGHGIEALTLVKVYGTVSKADSEELADIDAEFVRNWHWGAFTFLMASGTQRGSEQWRKLNQVDLDDIYDPEPDDQYYELRLGTRNAP